MAAVYTLGDPFLLLQGHPHSALQPSRRGGTGSGFRATSGLRNGAWSWPLQFWRYPFLQDRNGKECLCPAP